MKRLLSVIVVWIMLLLPSMAQVQATQTIRGQVSDVASGEPMAGVSIQVENGTTYQTMTDMAGNFVINNVPVGRHAVRATYVGYEPVLIKELLLSASKELVLSLSMRETSPFTDERLHPALELLHIEAGASFLTLLCCHRQQTSQHQNKQCHIPFHPHFSFLEIHRTALIFCQIQGYLIVVDTRILQHLTQTLVIITGCLHVVIHLSRCLR